VSRSDRALRRRRFFGPSAANKMPPRAGLSEPRILQNAAPGAYQKEVSPLKDMASQRFGRLTVVRRAGTGADGIAMWLCRCDCGDRSFVVGSGLRRGRTKSCGRYGRRTGTMNTTHGHRNIIESLQSILRGRLRWRDAIDRQTTPSPGMAERESRCASAGAAAFPPSSPISVRNSEFHARPQTQKSQLHSVKL
jgi:hypothetical protein